MCKGLKVRTFFLSCMDDSSKYDFIAMTRRRERQGKSLEIHTEVPNLISIAKVPGGRVWAAMWKVLPGQS